MVASISISSAASPTSGIISLVSIDTDQAAANSYSTFAGVSSSVNGMLGMAIATTSASIELEGNGTVVVATAESITYPCEGVVQVSGGLNVRASGSTSAKITGKVYNYTLVTVQSYEDGWYYISYNDGEKSGYVSAEYVVVGDEALVEKANSIDGDTLAAYACQFIGNPYKWGGTSLTNGCDCSGFVRAVYSHYGITLPHSSYSLRSVGYQVSVSDMQPGDIVCYSGQVGIDVGDGMIVNALNSKKGICLTSVYYKKIICVRRVL